jgi:hypothetical protein
MVYPNRRVALLFGKVFVFFYDLSDLLKVGADLWLVTGVFTPITGWLGMF